MGALLSGIDEVDDTVADWEASVEAGAFLGARRRNKRSCLAEPTKQTKCSMTFWASLTRKLTWRVSEKLTSTIFKNS